MLVLNQANIFPDCTLLLETLCDLARGIMEAYENRSIEREAMFEGGRGVNQLVDTGFLATEHGQCFDTRL